MELYSKDSHQFSFVGDSPGNRVFKTTWKNMPNEGCTWSVLFV